MVANRGKDPLTLGVYAADGFTTEAGQLDLVTKGAKSIAVGAWVHAGKDSVTIPAGKTVKVPFTVTIPENATPRRPRRWHRHLAGAAGRDGDDQR